MMLQAYDAAKDLFCLSVPDSAVVQESIMLMLLCNLDLSSSSAQGLLAVPIVVPTKKSGRDVAST